MSAAIGGRSEGIGAAPDRSIAEQTSQIQKKTALTEKEKIDFKSLSEEELAVLTGADADSLNVPFGARLGNLFARSNFLQGLSNKFIGAPSGANVDRKLADARVTQLEQTIADAKLAQIANSTDRNTLEKGGLQIFAGSPLDFAFSNKARSINNIIAQAEAEKRGIALQTDTQERKRVFENFTVITDKKFGKGRRRGVFDTSGKLGLDSFFRRGQPSITEEIQKQQFFVASEEAAIANKEAIKSDVQRVKDINIRLANADGNAGRARGRVLQRQRAVGQADLQSVKTDFGAKEFFTDQILSQRTNKASNRVFSQKVADANAERISVLDDKISRSRAFNATRNKRLGAPLSTRLRLQGRRTNSKGISPKERDQIAQGEAAVLNSLIIEREALTTIANRDIVKVAANPDIRVQRQASLFEAISTMSRVLGLPQFSGKRGSAPQLKANLGALTKVQNQRLEAQKKSRSRFQTKIDFDKELADISSSGTLNQKEKRSRTLAAARKRDEALKTQVVANTQFEQSRAGFAAAQTNIVSGNQVRLVQDFIDLGREKRRRRRLGEEI